MSLSLSATKYNELKDFLPQLALVTTANIILAPDDDEVAALVATGRIEPEDFTHGPTWQETLADVGHYWMLVFQPYRICSAMAWRRGVPASFWLEDYPHDVLWDADHFLAAIRTVVIDSLGPRRPDVHDLDEAEACRELSLNALPMLTRLAEARLATEALEANELEYDAPELLTAYRREDDLDSAFHKYFGTAELGDKRVVLAFGPSAPFRHFLHTTSGGS